jgi:hypothetical protein
LPPVIATESENQNDSIIAIAQLLSWPQFVILTLCVGQVFMERSLFPHEHEIHEWHQCQQTRVNDLFHGGGVSGACLMCADVFVCLCFGEKLNGTLLQLALQTSLKAGRICWHPGTYKINPLKTKLVLMLFKNSVRTSKRTPYFTITKIN